MARENTALYPQLTAFSMDRKSGENEKSLRSTAVAAYHDIAWRLTQRNQTVRAKAITT